jgi:hypothetical protein
MHRFISIDSGRLARTLHALQRSVHVCRTAMIKLHKVRPA